MGSSFSICSTASSMALDAGLALLLAVEFATLAAAGRAAAAEAGAGRAAAAAAGDFLAAAALLIFLVKSDLRGSHRAACACSRGWAHRLRAGAGLAAEAWRGDAD